MPQPLAQTRLRPSATSGPSEVTVVVMTRDRWPDLQRSLPRHEGPVILVDNGSTDGTPELVRRTFPEVRVVELGENQGAVARNVGVELADTPFVAFADDDSWWAPGALGQAAAILARHPAVAVLAARMLVGADHRPDPICEAMAGSPLGRAPGLPGPEILGFLACGAVVRRNAFLEAGGFDEVVFFMGEEERLALDLAARGWHLTYVEELVAFHEPSPNRDRYRRQVRATRNRVLTALMRRPWPVVGRTVLDAAMDGPAGRAGVWEAGKRIGPALARREPVPAHVERARRLLDRPAAVNAPAPPTSPPSVHRGP